MRVARGRERVNEDGMVVVGSNPPVTINVTFLSASGSRWKRVGGDVERAMGSEKVAIEDMSIDERESR